jgi:hypothetical protein
LPLFLSSPLTVTALLPALALSLPRLTLVYHASAVCC